MLQYSGAQSFLKRQDRLKMFVGPMNVKVAKSEDIDSRFAVHSFCLCSVNDTVVRPMCDCFIHWDVKLSVLFSPLVSLE